MEALGTLVRVQDSPTAPAVPASQPHIVWILLAVGALFLAILARRLRGRRPSERLGTFEGSSATAREELERVLTEIQDLSREHISRLDTKIRLLTQLLAECDQKKKELEALLARVAGAGAPRPEPPPPSRPGNPLHDQVYALQDSGKNIFDICSATGLEKGEVELILGLRKMRP